MRKRLTVAALLGLTALSSTSEGGGKVFTEAVTQYEACYGAGSDLPNSIANNEGFRDIIVCGPSCWGTGLELADGSVIDKDFVDPEKTGSTLNANDTFRFDSQEGGIAYFTGHGVCDGATFQPCLMQSTCGFPQVGQSLPGTCKNAPGFNTPLCHYYTPRHLLTCNPGNDVYNGDVTYSNGFVKWGESPSAGSVVTPADWGGAGTNGGINLAVLDLSCGALPGYETLQLGPVFAGLHFVATIMPVNGDTANVATRGSVFASRWAINPEGSVAQAWMDTLVSLPSGLGVQCGTPAVGGGHGINGCGTNLIMTVDRLQSLSKIKLMFENWNDLKEDIIDGEEAFYYSEYYVCNYDCDANPILLD